MSPYFNKNRTKDDLIQDIIITLKYKVKWGKHFERRQIVLINHPFKKCTTLKIIVGIGGDWIKQKDSYIYHKIPEGYCWVEDNKNLDDSNIWGPVCSTFNKYILMFIQNESKFRFL